MILVSTDKLNNELLGKAKIIDATWHFLPNRNAFEEYEREHIENAIFFDLEENSNKEKNLPHKHFLPNKKDWEKYLSKIGISNDDKILMFMGTIYSFAGLDEFISKFKQKFQTDLQMRF